MTEAQRAAMYRTRRHEAALEVQEDIAGASTRVLLDALHLQLNAMESEDQDVRARAIAEQIIRELCARHNLRIESTR